MRVVYDKGKNLPYRQDERVQFKDEINSLGK